MRVVHIIAGLGVGGAETMLCRLVGGLDRRQFEPTVVSLTDGGELRSNLEAMSVPVHSLGMKRGLPDLRAMIRLRHLARELAPDLVQGWMYHGNLAAWQMARLAPGRPALLWNIRHALYDLAHEKRATRAVIRLGARLSRAPRTIIFNSAVSVTQHEALGYDTTRARVLPNGFDLDLFKPDSQAREDLLRVLGLPARALLVGIAGRHHPIKGHEDFLRAVALVQTEYPEAHFLLAGQGLAGDDQALNQLAGQLPAHERVHWLGYRSNMAALLAGLDVLVLSSLSEGFPNVLGEAMACGVPCVSTAVGAAPEIVADCGRLVPPGDPRALASAMNELLALAPGSRRELGVRARLHIQDNYALEAVAGLFAELYRTWASETPIP